MKNYNTLPVDCSAIVAEVQAYLVANPGAVPGSPNGSQWFPFNTFVETNSTFATLGLTINNTALITINNLGFVNIDNTNRVCIPINFCSSAILSVYTVNPGAVAIPNTFTPPLEWLPHQNYNVTDCTLVETTSLAVPLIRLASAPILWDSPETTNQSVLLLLTFNESTDFLLAD